MSFDNILYSYYTLFALMIVNNWQYIMVRPPLRMLTSTCQPYTPCMQQGHVAVTGELARLYFILYIVFMVNIASNIIIAYLLGERLSVVRVDQTPSSLAAVDAFVKLHPLIVEKDSKDPAAELLLRLGRRLLGYKDDVADKDDDNDNNSFKIVSLNSSEFVAAFNTVSIYIPLNILELADSPAATEALFTNFLLSMSRSANNQSPYEYTFLAKSKMLNAYVQKQAAEQKVFVIHFPLGTALTVTNSLEPKERFQEHVLPTLRKLYHHYQAKKDAPALLPSESAAQQVTTQAGEDGEQQLVHHLMVPESFCRSDLPPDCRSMRSLDKIRDMIKRTRPDSERMDVYFSSARRIARQDVTQVRGRAVNLVNHVKPFCPWQACPASAHWLSWQALWGDDLQKWAASEDTQIQVLAPLDCLLACSSAHAVLVLASTSCLSKQTGWKTSTPLGRAKALPNYSISLPASLCVFLSCLGTLCRQDRVS